MAANFSANPLITVYCLLITALILAACAPSSPIPQTSPIAPIATQIEFNSGEVLLLSMEENGYAHFFLYTPAGDTLLRLTGGDWNDIAPALNPDGTQIAFASNRSGYWDLYLLTLATGETRQITSTPAYDSAPTWSPDGLWLAYETYDGADLEIAALNIADTSVPPIVLTDSAAADFAPAWSPQGRRIAFTSNRSGNPDIWLADLDRPDEGRFVNISASLQAAEGRPQWSGEQLMWIAEAQGINLGGAYIWDATQPARPARWIAEADLAAWNPSADKLMTVVRDANVDYLSASSLDGRLILPPKPFPGLTRALLWLTLDLSETPQAYLDASALTPSALWNPTIFPIAEGPSGRERVVDIADVQAPYPKLHDEVNEAFNALRARVIAETGWDALASLQNAYVPLTNPLDPGLGQDWLYTGRGFALNSLLANAGWMVSVREGVGQQTYWRIYLRAQSQDGSQGAPLNESPWDLNARYDVDPQAYDQGGAYAPIPPGYWVDFTALARAYGFERQSALPNWRVYFAGTRFTEFVMTDGLDWYNAMLQLYPAEALVTPTPKLPPTLTPTLTPVPTLTSGPSPTPTITASPTNTPLPTSTPTPVPSNTPLP
ncbi:MAG: TolB family protein [Chloroflexi bacterium]|nr:TolB family protein [Chloroflexota bacterium]